jgi:hypothetical protein
MHVHPIIKTPQDLASVSQTVHNTFYDTSKKNMEPWDARGLLRWHRMFTKAGWWVGWIEGVQRGYELCWWASGDQGLLKGR